MDLSLKALRSPHRHWFYAEAGEASRLVKRNGCSIAFCDRQGDDFDADSLAGVPQGAFDQLPAEAFSAPCVQHVHAEQVSLMPGLGPGRKFQRDAAHQLAVAESTEGDGAPLLASNPLFPPRRRQVRALAWFGGESIWFVLVAMQYQCAVLRGVFGA